MLNRRSNAVHGFVNFPINDSAFKSTKEGGMFVKLVVLAKNDFETEQCCGCGVYDFLQESFVGSDHPLIENPHLIESDQERYEAFDKNKKQYFPNCHDFEEKEYRQKKLAFLNIMCPALSVTVIGSTGWSGWHEEEGKYWHCTYDDLTEDGKNLFESIRKLYPNNPIHLLTFLDT